MKASLHPRVSVSFLRPTLIGARRVIEFWSNFRFPAVLFASRVLDFRLAFIHAGLGVGRIYRSNEPLDPGELSRSTSYVTYGVCG
jgi:hypothetical protein